MNGKLKPIECIMENDKQLLYEGFIYFIHEF